MQTIDPKKREKVKGTPAGKKPVKKVSMSYHPDLRGANLVPSAAQWGTGIMGSFPASSNGVFQEDRKTKQPQRHESQTMLGGYCFDGRSERNSRDDRHSRHGGNVRNTGYNRHGFRERSVCADIPRYGLDGLETYSNTCCGKCKHHLRVWRSRVWVCDNICSEKHGFPTDYGNTCDSFERENRGNW